MQGIRIALVGLLLLGAGLAGAEPPAAHRLGDVVADFRKAVSVRDWAAPPAPGDATAQADSAPPVQPESPLPAEAEPGVSPVEPVSPEEAPAAPAETLPPPLPPVQPLPPVEPTAPPPAAPPVAGRAPSEGPTLLQRAIRLEEVNVDELYRSFQQIFPQQSLQLTLEQCVYRALQANQSILVATFEPLKASADVLSAKGQFDPQLGSQATYLRSSQSASSEVQTFGGIASIETYQTTSQSGIQGKLPLGTMYNLALNLSREETTFTQLREQWYGGLTLTVTQPLLRGAGFAVNRAQIRLARNARHIADSQLRGTILTAVADTVRAYWDLVGAMQNVEAREKAVNNAARLLEIQRKRLELGNAAEIEVVQAQAGLTARKSDLISAHAQVQNASQTLKSLIGLTSDDLVSPKLIVPADSPVVSDIPLNGLQSASLALQNRPEIEGAMLQIEGAKIDQKRLANGMLPQFDIVGSRTQGGRGHFTSDVFDGVEDNADWAYTVGFQGSVPIGNRTARGAYQRAELTTRQAQQQLEQARQQVILNVELALNAVVTSRVLVESTKQTAQLQEINLEAEAKRLELGVTTSYRVLEIESDLTTARTQHIQALVGYQKALTDLRLAEGVLLDVFGVGFEPPEADKPVSYLRSVAPWPVKVEDSGK